MIVMSTNSKTTQLATRMGQKFKMTKVGEMN